jgi:uncharacterized LabA/DUF88 family protein
LASLNPTTIRLSVEQLKEQLKQLTPLELQEINRSLPALLAAQANKPPQEPATKRASAFVDGQHLFKSAKEIFGYNTPNYDVKKLALRICNDQNWNLQKIYFYTGIHKARFNKRLQHFWHTKLNSMRQQGIVVFKKELLYVTPQIAREKGIDVRLSLDLVQATYRGDLDVALIISQDSDLSEAVKDAHLVAKRTLNGLISHVLTHTIRI